MKVLSVHKVLELAGGPAGLQKLMYRAGQPFPSFQQIANWQTRNSIPGWWIGAIIYTLACKRINPLKLLTDTRG
jgi:hypothetical protein